MTRCIAAAIALGAAAWLTGCPDEDSAPSAQTDAGAGAGDSWSAVPAGDEDAGDDDAAPNGGSAGTSAASPDAGPLPAPPLVREGSPVALSRDGARVYVACEELRALRVVPASGESAGRAVPMPGAPANLVVLGDDRVLATIRDPGLLLVLRPDADKGLVETARVEVAADAWGLAVAADGATAYVTSAWTHTVTAVDLAARQARWTLDVAREPRGIVAHPRGPVYVSHLTSAAITRIDPGAAPRAGGAGGGPAAHVVSLPLAPLRAPRTGTVEGSLGYSLTFSPDGMRLFAPRHALGAVGLGSWFGAATIDVMLVPQDTPLAPPRAAELVEKHSPPESDADTYPTDDTIDPATAPLPGFDETPFSAPRAIVYRRSTRTVLVAGEGTESIVEFDALAPDPTLAPVERHVMDDCPAPTGIALAGGDGVAYVYCRASFTLYALPLDTRYGEGGGWKQTLGRDPLDAVAAAGRKLFYMSTRTSFSEGLACAGCHPEGRDDGHVWREAHPKDVAGAPKFLGERIFLGGDGILGAVGVPRQTPMLAGRLRSAGPYGWLGESADLVARIDEGTKLHRWHFYAPPTYEARDLTAAFTRLAAFLRKGLVAPPRAARAPSEIELRGKQIFERADVGCATCHAADDSAPNLVVKLPKLARRAGFDDEDAPLKVPVLLYVGGTPPYLHDGSAATLEQLVDQNGDRMGHTAKLTPDERASLVAYLETL
jgi:DNA-binding beta-propeller fold protein YncE